MMSYDQLSSCEVTINEKNDGYSSVTRNNVKVCLPSIDESIKGNKGEGRGKGNHFSLPPQTSSPGRSRLFGTNSSFQISMDAWERTNEHERMRAPICAQTTFKASSKARRQPSSSSSSSSLVCQKSRVAITKFGPRKIAADIWWHALVTMTTTTTYDNCHGNRDSVRFPFLWTHRPITWLFIGLSTYVRRTSLDLGWGKGDETRGNEACVTSSNVDIFFDLLSAT